MEEQEKRKRGRPRVQPMIERDVKHREISQKFVDDRAVRAPLFAAVSDMTRWQREAAHLRALLDSPKARRSADIDARILALRCEVNDARLKVDSVCMELPERLKNHGRIRDIAGAMKRLEALVAAL